MWDLATRVKSLTSSASQIVLVPYDEAYEAGFEDMPRRVPDLTKIRDLVGYAPRVELDEILRRVVEHSRAAMSLVS
jgi:UDP-glucose 4-epimerase